MASRKTVFAVVMVYGNGDEYAILFIEAGDKATARFRAYDRDRVGSIVAVAECP